MKCDYLQILDMKENELGMLATHLGHDPKTHKAYYRLSSETVELTTVRTHYSKFISNVSLAELLILRLSIVVADTFPVSVTVLPIPFCMH